MTQSVDFEQLLGLEMEMKTFTSDWLHCDQLSGYIARMVSHDRRDPLRYANLLSSALNELLEMSFQSPTRHGELHCHFSRRLHIERIELTFPCPREKRQHYVEVVFRLQTGSVRESYLDLITRDTCPIDKAILMGLIVNYDAEIEICDLGSGAIRFVVDLPLERLLN